MESQHRNERESRGSSAVSVAQPIETQRILSVFGANTRAGYWEPPERLEVMAMFGGVKLDFRNANLYSGPTVVNCFVLFGGIDIIAPPELEVDANGIGLFGGFDHKVLTKSRWGLFRRDHGDDFEETANDLDDEPPLLRVRGFAMFGGVTIKVK